jgi:hypothetical protein
MTGALDRFLDFAARYKRPLLVVGGVWFVLSWANTARFIDLPEIPLLTGPGAIIASTVYNAIWWGFINPRIERRRKARADITIAGAQNG